MMFGDSELFDVNESALLVAAHRGALAALKLHYDLTIFDKMKLVEMILDAGVRRRASEAGLRSIEDAEVVAIVAATSFMQLVPQ